MGVYSKVKTALDSISLWSSLCGNDFEGVTLSFWQTLVECSTVLSFVAPSLVLKTSDRFCSRVDDDNHNHQLPPSSQPLFLTAFLLLHVHTQHGATLSHEVHRRGGAVLGCRLHRRKARRHRAHRAEWREGPQWRRS